MVRFAKECENQVLVLEVDEEAAAPRRLCQEDCKGICPRCGTNRNRQECRCEEKFVDTRWDALRNLELKSKN